MSTFPPLPLVLLPSFTLASPDAAANDGCLVGSWQPQGNAMADWLRRQNPAMAVHAPPARSRLVLRADASYSTGAEASASSRSGELAADIQGRFTSSGTWRSEGNRLLLTPARASNQAQMRIQGRAGSTRMQLPAAIAGGPLQREYRCSGERLETRQRLPGSSDVVVQPYLRR